VRASFELKFFASDYESAKEIANTHISRFFDISQDQVAEKVDTELKVELVDGKFEVTAFGKLKANFSAFGLDKHK
jgi:hypothetical protein